LESIPDDKLAQKAIVLYKLALGKSRDGDLTGAIEHLVGAAKIKDSRVANKITSLLDRLQYAQSSGKDFKMRAVTVVDPTKHLSDSPATDAKDGAKNEIKLATDDDYRRMLAAVDTKRGDLCCFLIFYSPGEGDARAPVLLAKPPRFQKRVAIERAEALLSNVAS